MASSPDHGEQFLIESFAKGKTIIFNAAEQYWPPVERIIADLKEALACDVKCNVYCTPPLSQGFDTHVDHHDVLVLQAAQDRHLERRLDYTGVRQEMEQQAE